MFSWLRRYSVLILIVVLAMWWFAWNRIRANRLAQQQGRYAQVVARLWVAGASFRNDSTGWAEYRDSVMDDYGVTRERLETYASRYEKKPERYLPFVQRVQELVDSLVHTNQGEAADSVKADSRSQGS